MSQVSSHPYNAGLAGSIKAAPQVVNLYKLKYRIVYCSGKQEISHKNNACGV